MSNLLNVQSAELEALRARLAADVECPRCGEVSCVWQECRD